MAQKEAASSSAGESPNRLTPEQATARMSEAVQGSTKAYREAEATLQKRMLDANRTYSDTVRQLYEDMRKRHEQVFKDLFAGAFEGAPGEDRSKQQAALGTRYSEMLADLQKEFEQAWERAYRDHTDAIASATTTASKAYTDAYRSYLQAQQRLWADLDIDAIVAQYARALGSER
jgi:hypothetical protein